MVQRVAINGRVASDRNVAGTEPIDRSLPVASAGGADFVWGTSYLFDADSALSLIAVGTPPTGGLPGFEAVGVELYAVHIAGSQIVLTPHTVEDPPDSGTFSATEIILPRPAFRDGVEVESQFRVVVQH